MTNVLSEKQKMLSGQAYYALDPELLYERGSAAEKQKRLNATDPRIPADQAVHLKLLRECFHKVGQGCHVQTPVYFDYGYNIELGENVYFNAGCVLLDVCKITVGNGTLFGPNVQVYTAAHPLDPVTRSKAIEMGYPITIGKNVWIGGSAVILPGVTIGDDSVVAAGSIVTKDVPAGVVVKGNPAR
ncbi:hypothetical protein HDV01_003725, partial [Terramyces sp. JEL0728]